jgi:DNA anti-recombination protein RmuC
MSKRRFVAHRLGVIIFFALIALGSSSCTYLHNPQKAVIAKETEDEFKKVQSSTAKVNQAMLDNLQKTEDRMTQRLAEIAEEKEKSFANQVSSVTWGQIQKDMEAVITAKHVYDIEIVKELTESENNIKNVQLQSQSAQKDLDQVKAALKEAVNEQNLWKHGERCCAAVCRRLPRLLRVTKKTLA